MIKPFDQFVNEDLTSKKIIFCDLDGVLVDFNKGFSEITENTEHLTPKEYEKKHGKNSIWPLLNKLGESFWANLHWTHDGRELWDYIKRYKPIILSAPSKSPACYVGKTTWVKNNLHINQEAVTDPSEFTKKTRFILANHKHEYVEPAKRIFNGEPILIDDYNKKLERWTKAGGTGVLHNDSTDSIRVLEEILTNS